MVAKRTSVGTRASKAETAQKVSKSTKTASPTKTSAARKPAAKVAPPVKSVAKANKPLAGTNGHCIGDQVVYPHHGVATILRIEQREILGQKKSYLVLKLDNGDLTLMVPAENIESVGIRGLIDKAQVAKVVSVLGSGKVTDHADNWSRRYKSNQELLRSGEVDKVAEVVRNLSIREKEKGLSTGEKRMLNRAREILTGELKVALNLEEEAAQQFLEDSLALV